MKRYLLFGTETYYPSGGVLDFIKDFEEYNDVIAYINYIIKKGKINTDSYDICLDFMQVLDTKDKKVIYIKLEYDYRRITDFKIQCERKLEDREL